MWTKCLTISDGQSPGFGSVLSVKRLDFKHFTVLKRSANPVIAQYCLPTQRSTQTPARNDFSLITILATRDPQPLLLQLTTSTKDVSKTLFRMILNFNMPSQLDQTNIGVAITIGILKSQMILRYHLV